MNVRKPVEAYLRQHPDGCTVQQLAEGTGANDRCIRQSLKVMPHVYVDRWAAAKAGPYRYQWVPVYALADMPPDAEKPERAPTHEDYCMGLSK